jgi:hypothetical protein
VSDDKPPQTREERLAAKLRENLRRRKTQARELDAAERGLSKDDTPR